MKEIVVISPINSLSEVTRLVIEAGGYTNIDILEGNNLQDGLALAEKAIKGGAKVLISRGGMFELIKAKFDIPIVEIKVTAFDLISSFQEIKAAGVKADEVLGVVGFHSVVTGADIVASVMGLNTVCFEITGQSDIVTEVEKLMEQGIKIFVGDGNVIGAIANHDCTAVLVNSGRQAIQDAVQYASTLLYATKQEKEKAQQFSTIIDFVHDGVIAIDNVGRITVFNSASEKMTGFVRQEALGRKINEIIPESRLLKILKTMQPELGEIQRLDNQTVIATNRVPVIVEGEVKGAVATYQDITELQRLEQKIRIRLSERGFVAQHTFADIIHRSDVISDCIKMAKKFSNFDASVLLCGPSGVGKEFFAQGIHNNSKRRNSPFVAINCAALPESLIESELFGYVEGSFTGAAKKGKAGLFEMAHGGTIFLDEISELPIVLQGRLLRVLQEKQVMRIGDNKVIPVDVRIVCATNRELRAQVALNQFRGDLYFRIATLSLFIPPLNARADDIELLSAHFVDEFGFKYRKIRMTFTPDALLYLRNYVYEGNVRELQGMIERAVMVCEGSEISAADLTVSPYTETTQTDESFQQAFPAGQSLKDIEDQYIDYVYKKTNGSVTETSAILGIARSTLWRKIKEKQIASAP